MLQPLALIPRPAAAWFALALLARAPFVARIEGALDHDQSVVGLMALDIAAARRFPLFFDGQRYMGAVEPYLAAVFVHLFGHTLQVIALAPLLAFALFTAGQFIVWSRWSNPATAHLAAALTLLCPPMLALWGVIPRGGYVVLLAWSLPTLAVYREVARHGRPPLPPRAQIGWGFLLALGYFLNPLSMIVYATLALDWIFIRHGASLRRLRLSHSPWLKSSLAALLWILIGSFWIVLLALCCHVDPKRISGGSPYVPLADLSASPLALPLGALGVTLLLALAGWWTRAPARLHATLSSHPWTLIGLLAATWPFVAQALLVHLGALPAAPSLPVWIAAPWKALPNLHYALHSLGPLIGSDPRAIETVLIGQGITPPPSHSPDLMTFLLCLNPFVIAIVLGLLFYLIRKDRPFWRRVFALHSSDVSPPVALASTFLAATAILFTLQATSPNASSIRYLIPLWVVLPGLLASALHSLPPRAAVLLGLCLVIPWTTAQIIVFNDLDHPAPARPLAAELERRGIRAIIAPTPVALIVANLTHGSVGAVEYQPIWPRLGTRYRQQFSSQAPLTCVVDRQFPWPIRGEGAWAPEQDLRRHLLGLSQRHPGRVRLSWSIASYEVWLVDLPLNEILALEPDGPSTQFAQSSP